MGGRIAEELVFGVISTGANNDLVGSTELARKMVAEWGMSERVGPMAWGSQGQVFLGEDLMHTRDYSDETARVIDEEVERILREGEDRCRQVLSEHRHGLDLVARALLEHETIDGSEVTRLINLAADGSGPGGPTGPEGTPVDAPVEASSGARSAHSAHGNGGPAAHDPAPAAPAAPATSGGDDALAWSRPPYPPPPTPPT
jgi:cell division protease FtsH